MVCDHSLGRNDILKFFYCFIILFLTVSIFKYFYYLYHLVTKRVQKCSHFKFEYRLFELESTCQFT
jgi:hypothetical protein